tara:strand:+ start:3478 stop:3894 length:417 start_codon:yes stop_codon:yes gene_type:complete
LTLKSFQIDWKGSPDTIEYDDDILFGDLENILNKCLDLKKVNEPIVNIPLYRQLILTAVITKAPFTLNDVSEIRNLKSSVAQKIMTEVMKDYPLMKYLEEWVGTFVGTEVDISTQSTTTSPKSSTGRKTKSTNNPPRT